MKKVKLLISDSHDFGDYDYQKILCHSITNWEEISDEDYEFLKTYKGSLGFGYSVIIVEEDSEPINVRVVKLRERMAGHIAAAKAAKVKRAEAAKRSAKKREATKKAKELDLLNKLKEKYE